MHYEFFQYLCIAQMAQRIMSDLTPHRSRMPKWHFKRSPKLPFVIHVRNKRPLNLTQPYWWSMGTCSGKCWNAGLWPLCTVLPQCRSQPLYSPALQQNWGNKDAQWQVWLSGLPCWSLKHPRLLLLWSSFGVLNTDINQALPVLIFSDFLLWYHRGKPEVISAGSV